MRVLTAQKLQTTSAHSVDELFSLFITHRVHKTLIVMQMLTETVNTRDIPETVPFLKQHLPSILSSTCYNQEKLPFALEVQRTEIGHLFEHILLEYLCQGKIHKGCDEAVFSGQTKWNWQKDPWGLFRIYLNLSLKDTDIFPEALEQSIALLRMVMQHSYRQPISSDMVFTKPPSSPFSSLELYERK